MDYAHSNLITVLNPKGEIIHQIDGFGADKEALVEKIIKYIEENNNAQT